MKIQSTNSNMTAINTNLSVVKQKAQLSTDTLQAKSVDTGPSFSQRISDGTSPRGRMLDATFTVVVAFSASCIR